MQGCNSGSVLNLEDILKCEEGLVWFGRLKQNAETSGLPLILLSNLTSEMVLIQIVAQLKFSKSGCIQKL